MSGVCRAVGMLASAFGLVGATLVVGGCSHGGGATTAAPQSGGTTQTASAETIYNSNNCARCHGSMTQGGGRAPDLSHVGAEAEHTAAWIADQIKNPQSHEPSSRMPAFQGTIPDADIQTLATALSSQK